MSRSRCGLRGACCQAVRTALALTFAVPAHGLAANGSSEPKDTFKAESKIPPTDVSINAHVGVIAYHEKTGGVLLGATALARHGILAAGANVETGGFVMHVTSVGALLGVALPTTSGPRLDLLATAGGHVYRHWGSELLSDDPGVSATLPYAGVVTRAIYLFPRDAHLHFSLGLIGALDTDLSRAHKQYWYTETGWLFGDTYSAFADHTAGGTRCSIALTFGGVADYGWD